MTDDRTAQTGASSKIADYDLRPCRVVADWCRTHQRDVTAECINPRDLAFRVLAACVGVPDAVAVVLALRHSGLAVLPAASDESGASDV